MARASDIPVMSMGSAMLLRRGLRKDTACVGVEMPRFISSWACRVDNPASWASCEADGEGGFIFQTTGFNSFILMQLTTKHLLYPLYIFRNINLNGIKRGFHDFNLKTVFKCP